jgi:hypothetical protein
VSNLVSSDEGVTWTGTLTPEAGVASADAAITLNLAGVSVGGVAGSGTVSVHYAVDTQAPTATISMADTALAAGETSTVTIQFSEAVNGFTLDDLAAANGALSNLASSDGGTTWTATFTPNTNVHDVTNVITLDTHGVTDSAGNIGSGTVASSNYSVDTQPASATIALTDNALKSGDTAGVTITFNRPVSGLTVDDLTVGHGTVSNLVSSDEGVTWTGTLTPEAGVASADAAITLNLAGVTVGGVPGSGTVSVHYAVDTQAPTATISMADTALNNGDTSTVTIQFSEAVSGFTLDDLAAANGTLSNLASNDEGLHKSWTATFTPNANVHDVTNVITLDTHGVTDSAGNGGSGSVASPNYSVDTQPASATIALTDTALKSGDTAGVTITFNRPVAGLTVDDLTVGHGTVSNLVSSDEGVTWTGTLTPEAGVESADAAITLDLAGVSVGGVPGSGTVSVHYAVDTHAPTATISMADTALNNGETSTVTIQFSEAVNGFTLDDLAAANGTLSNLASNDEGLHKSWTATFTPNANVHDVTNVITLDTHGVTDSAGNSGSGSVASPNYSVDTRPASATIALSDSALKSGDTAGVTITFNRPVAGLTVDDLTVGHGTVSNLVSHDEGVTWTGTLTPAAGVASADAAITLDLAGVSAGGVAGSGTVSVHYAVDTQAPTATISMADTALAAGETSTVTIQFSEAVNGFTLDDLAATNGALSNLASSDGGRTWTATFTPAADVTSGTNAITLANAGLADASGNAGNGTTVSANYTVDTHVAVVVPPVPSSLVDGTVVQTQTTIGADGSTQQVITIPTVTETRTNTDGALTLADVPLVFDAAGNLLVGVGVPTGVSVSASGPAAVQDVQAAMAAFTQALQAHVAAPEALQTMVSGIAGFLNSLAANATSLVQTITATWASGIDTTSNPLLIHSGAQGSGHPASLVVLDSSMLPGGAAIELEDVGFAALIGAMRVTGGAGSQTVYGDGASQYIVLGADDDVLHGGGANDIVGSEGGNDHIYGDAGDDTVFGGAGNDVIDGGTGHDTLRLVGSGRDDYTLRVENGALVVTQRGGGVDGSDIVSNVEALHFAGATASLDVDATLARLYETLFGRTIDASGKAHWLAQAKAGESLHDIAQDLLASVESQQSGGAQGNGTFVDRVYQSAFGHAADAQGRAYWVGQLDSGALDRATVALAVANSNEKLALDAANATNVDFNTTDVASIVRLYDTAFHRASDEGGINFWIGQSEGGMSLGDIASHMLGSTEGTQLYGGLTNEAFVAELYTDGLGRDGSAQDVHWWVQQLASGAATRGQVLLEFADSAEHAALVGVVSTSIATI